MRLVLDPAPCPQPATPTSGVLLPAMSTVTSQAMVAVPAVPCHEEEKVDNLVREETGVKEEVARDGERISKDGTPKKTQEEFEAEMEDHLGAKENGTTTEATSAVAQDDVDMIE
jgi:hypothetical protein